MFLPFFQNDGTKLTKMLHFGGLDLRHKPSDASLSQAENMSAEAFPALMPRKSREMVAKESGITAAIAPEYTGAPITAFTGVKENGFYYQGTRIGTRTLTDGEKSLVDFNGKICIFPDKLYYDYLPDPDTGEVYQDLKPMEKTLSLSNVTFYSSMDELTESYTAYLQKNGADFDACFAAGDSIAISGASKKQNNTVFLQSRKAYAEKDAIVSAVVESCTKDRLNLLLYTKSGSKALFENTTDSSDVTVKRTIPDMNHVCVHNNRLWGTGTGGEYLYASKLGDCFSFHSFQGMEDDSWYSVIGTPGEFCGIVSYRSAVVAFKHHCIHHVYGDGPKNYAIPKQTMGGCIDGRSIQELGGVLYYLSANGICAYSGGEPYGVSPQLPAAYRFGVAGTDGRCYYLSATCEDGTKDLLVYDPEKNLWQREDDTEFLAFIHFGNRLYGVVENGILAFAQGNERVSWSFTTAPMTYDSLKHKGVNTLWILLDKEESAEVSVSISHNQKDFVPCGILSAGAGLKGYRVPIRFQTCDSFRLRIKGQGKAVIHALEMSVYQGGKTYDI